MAESGSFGKSTRRSRSRTGTPARAGREDPTLAAADKLFGDWVAGQQATTGSQRRSQSVAAAQDDPSTTSQRVIKSTPVELILRGYRSSLQQYAAISHYEDVAGIVLEDYPRDPPASQRRWKSDLRDPAMIRDRHLTPEERALVNRADGGEHWVKVTFESTEAAELATYSSPQCVLGHMVYAEPYRGHPPARDEACPDVDHMVDDDHHGRSQSMPPPFATTTTPSRRSAQPPSLRSRLLDLSPSNSHTSTQTLETGTLSNTTINADLATGPSLRSATSPGTDVQAQQDLQPDSMFCRRIPTARKARLLPAEQALLPQQSLTQQILNAIPLVKWFGGSMIGNEVPRTETGDFDWNRASLYWKIIWWLDTRFGLFKGDVCSVDKDE